MTTLSEADSKRRLAPFGIPFADERVVTTAEGAVAAAVEVGLPVVVKLCGDSIAHKTERGLVRLNLGAADAVFAAAIELLDRATPEDGAVELLVAPMILGARELIAGAVRDERFGPCVMLGIGGVLAEAIADVQIRLAPIERVDADEMIDQLETQAFLGAFRGEPAVHRAALAAVLIELSKAVTADDAIASIDLNPLIVSPNDGRPIAVDALVELRS
jgi:acetyl-CoA synthetase (ADP-forming)